jgi:hypothetical protein
MTDEEAARSESMGAWVDDRFAFLKPELDTVDMSDEKRQELEATIREALQMTYEDGYLDAQDDEDEAWRRRQPPHERD